MDHINFNGKIIPADTPVIDADNRGLRFGDGLFETIKFRHNQFQLIEEHLDRLWKGLQLFQFELPVLFTREYLQTELRKLVNKNKHTHARVRLTIVRGPGGLYDPMNHHPVFIIQSWQLDEEYGRLNINGSQLCIYTDVHKTCDQFSNLKHNNFLPYVMGALFARSQQCNDAIILNQHNNICDTTIANIFLVKDNIICTPALQDGCIAGTMRHFMIQQLPQLGYTVVENTISESQLADADEIFLTNSMTPVKWVAGIGEKKYDNRFILEMYDRLKQTFPDIFC